MRAIGYTRVSTEEQGSSELGLAAQRKAIERAAEYHGWELVEIFPDVASGRSTNRRPGLSEALACVADRDCADILVVAKLDRLSRSVLDFANLMERARSEGWSIVLLDLNVDTTTATGKMFANMLANLAQWERELIGERTTAALAEVKAKGRRLGRPPVLSKDVRRRIKRARRRGRSYRQIAAALTAAAVPTARGGQVWYASTVRDVCLSEGSGPAPDPKMAWNRSQRAGMGIR